MLSQPYLKSFVALIVVSCVAAATAADSHEPVLAGEPAFKAESDALVACLNKKIDVEASKLDPELDVLLGHCTKEYRAFINQFHPEARPEMKRLVRGDIGGELSRVSVEKREVEKK